MKQELESATAMPDSENSSCETRNVSVVNGYIVYTRAKRSLNSCNAFSEKVQVKKRFKTCDDEVVEANAELQVKLENNELKNELSEVVVRTFKRFTRSALKANVVENGDDKAHGGMNDSVSHRNKLELKMSKKIVVNRKPMTVKELFDTGLLDGVSVVYNGGIKNKKVRSFHRYALLYVTVFDIVYFVKKLIFN